MSRIAARIERKLLSINSLLGRPTKAIKTSNPTIIWNPKNLHTSEFNGRICLVEVYNEGGGVHAHTNEMLPKELLKYLEGMELALIIKDVE